MDEVLLYYVCVLQIWVNSPHNANGYFTIYGDDSLHPDHFDAHLATGDTQTAYARTGYLGFVRRTELTQSDGGKKNFTVIGCLTCTANSGFTETMENIKCSLEPEFVVKSHLFFF